MLAQERICKRLYLKEKLSMKQVCRRLGCTLFQVRQHLEKPPKLPKFRKAKKVTRRRFEKLHERARHHIISVLQNATYPVHSCDLQQSLEKNVQLHCSRAMIRRYLKQELLMSYKQVRQINHLHNNRSSKMQRQYAAQQFVQLLSDGKRIINIDESVLNETFARRRGWTAPYIKNKVTHSQRLMKMNLIIAVSSTGEFFYTVNRGTTNYHSFLYFICKLCRTMDKLEPGWRSHTVLMLDNARYHRSKDMMNRYEDLRLSVLFLGPYHFKLAPAELMYSCIKSQDLNPLNARGQSRQLCIPSLLQRSVGSIHEGSRNGDQQDQSELCEALLLPCAHGCTGFFGSKRHLNENEELTFKSDSQVLAHRSSDLCSQFNSLQV